MISTSLLEFLAALSKALSWAMQVSILVPLVVMWRYRQHFSPPLHLLSWYVYLSLISAIGIRLTEFYQLPDWPILAVFNFSKIALFGGVYYQVLHHRLVRRVVLVLTSGAMAFALYSMLQIPMSHAVTYARVLQCALLAGFALAYLEQLSREPPAGHLHHNSLFLVSVAQLLYSAGTVMYFSIDYVKTQPTHTKISFGIVAVLGLLFNALLTLAFLRARPVAASPPPGTLAPAPIGRFLH